MARTYYYQETRERDGTPIDGQPITLETEIWSDGESTHEALTMSIDSDGYWWAFERDSGLGIKLTEGEHDRAKKEGFAI